MAIRAIDSLGEALFSVAVLVVLLTLLVYADTLRRVLTRTVPAAAKTHSAFVISVYPVVALATLCAVIVPRAQLLAEAVTQGVFMAAVYQLWCLLVAYCGGEAELIRRVKPGSLNPRVGPCCCWPCCLLPMLAVNKRNVCLLRVLVLQLPVVQGLLYLALLVMWAEEESLYEVNYMYLQPIVVVSILTGIWGLLMTIKMLSTVLAGHLVLGKFVALQAVLLLAKFQGLAARALAWYDVLPCNPPLTPAVYANLMYNTAMLVEMLLLALFARALYSKDIPDLTDPQHEPQATQVCVIEVAGQKGELPGLPAPQSNNNNYNKAAGEEKTSYKL
ncbi:organic solute transporter alpha-like protein [Thrips palmi]|uniref:Organic solute transporter alpha-like protein n=1 Tax=Thrips palmi TaxID=161013 RepID=A0A6P9A7U6_THRPL|nr:organic solute transporter alpha-like protein [Thrips palmi]